MGLESQCVHCGFCLEACPTYVVTRSEVHSPRGRITAVKLGVPTEGIETCMFCRRCELACPSGVEYGKLLHNVRRPTPLKFAVNLVMENPALAYKIIRSARGTNSRLLSRIRTFLPDPSEPLEYREETPDLLLFPGCVTSISFRKTVENALNFIKSLGYKVEIVNGCCGLSHYSEGEKGRSSLLIERLRSRFQGKRVVSLSANCSAHMKEMGLEIEDFSEFALKHIKEKRVDIELTVHDPCHANLVGLTKVTREVLKRLNVKVREMDEPSFECGAGGGYFIFHPEIADQVMEEKARKVRKSGTELVLSTNPVCSIALAFKGLKPVHLADILSHGS
ncbi:(Fe-S)-binding protein [Metallosphaera tengchongensis]|uniref:(Fe-S)-binding protein n=1 Tax=Metallosphaera tengchongensis TaxID=1532350 RepID=A0A6N0NVU5_9CREN|nr:(Fe-S)-binding protein [Metallosphaera tengchongensis]QKR00347.1 (Fe-S)-binding protein [Metallosphaera tengchongensis]